MSLRAIARKLLGKRTRDPELESLQQVIAQLAPYTLVSYGRLLSLHRSARKLAAENVPGAFVECGTCRGGSAAVIARAAKLDGWKRELFLFDSFQGHPPTASAEAPDAAEVQKFAGTLVASVRDVQCALETAGAFNDQKVHIVPGWFQDTLPTTEMPGIALLHLDGDFYDSTRCCLENLYDKVASGGIIQVDDYSYEVTHGCRKAVDEFLRDRNGYQLTAVECALVIHKN